MADDFALGSALVIPKGVLDDLERFDQNLEKIQSHIKGVPSSVNKLATAFGNLGNKNLDVMATNLDAIANAIAKLSTSNLDSGLNSSLTTTTQIVRELNGAITTTAHTVDRLNSGKVVSFDGAMTSASEASSIKERQEAIKQLIQVRQELSTKDADYATKLKALNDKIAELTALNKEAVMTEKEKQQAQDKSIRQAAAHTQALNAQARAQAGQISAQARLESANARMISATARNITAQERLAKAQAQAVTDPQLALKMAREAKSIEERTNAIKALESARSKLKTTDRDYMATLEQLNGKIKELTQANKEAVASSKLLSDQYNTLGGIAERMGKRMLLAFSLDTVKNFANQLVAVRGNFELQQRSLEAILQNKVKADEIFNQTVQLAVKSPFKIQELVTYTKQLAAYRIESDKLYDTTKRLADVSAGLGVDMQRLILAYGQVKAAAYLRGTEVRQFTEAGINLYGELQRYFEEVKGEAYTTAEIVDMISKRKVTFEDIEQIFKRLTDSGGLFYNMQEIQSETLQGKISNLADSFDVMYNEIGKANEGVMKGMVDGARLLIKNWETIVSITKGVIAVLALLALHSKRTGVSLKAMFTTDTTAVKAKSFNDYLEKLIKNLKKAYKNAKIFGRNLMDAFKKNAVLIAVALMIEAILDLWSTFSEYNDKLADVKKAHAEQENTIYSLARAYEELKASQRGVNDETPSSSPEIKKRLAAVKNIVAELNKMGIAESAIYNRLGITQTLESMNAGQLETAYRKLINYMQEANNSVLEFGKAYADVSTGIQGWFHIFGDNIVSDAKDLSDKEEELIGKSTKFKEILNYIGSEYSNLNDEAKIYYNSVNEGQDREHGEGQIQYLLRLQQAYAGIIKSMKGSKIADELNKNLLKIDIDWSGLESAEKEFRYELNKMKASINTKDPMKLKAAIDKTAVDASWTEYQKQLAYKEFKVPLIFDIDNARTQQSFDYIADYLKDLSEQGKFSIDVKADIDTEGLKKWIDTGNAAAKAAKNFDEQYKKVYDGLNHSGEQMLTVSDEIKKVLDEVGTFKFNLGERVDRSVVERALKTLKQQYTELALDFGVNPFEKKGRKGHEVDWQALQIEALEKMQQRWQNLVKFIGMNDAGELVKKQFETTLKYVRMPQEIIDSYIPQTKKALADAIDKIIPAIKDVKKKAEAMLKVQQLRIEVQQEEFKKSLKEAKDMAEKYLDEFELNIKLKDLGLDEAQIFDLFGNLETNLDNIKSKMEDMFETSYGKSKDLWDADQTNEFLKAYEDTIKKIDKKRTDNDMKVFEELTKSYKSQMEGQLKIDVWYANERKKILENSQLKKNDNLRNSYLFNLENEYKKRTEQNKWDMFKDSSYYTFVFDNLEQQSTAMLQRMLNNLEQLRSSLKTLDPSELKVIIDQENKIQDMIAGRNPFKTLISGMKEYIKLAKDRKKLEDQLAQSEVNKMLQSRYVSELNEQYQLALKNYKVAKDTYGANSEQAKKARKNVDAKHEELQVALNLLVTNKRISKELADQLAKILGLKKELQSAAKTVVDYINASASAFESIFYAIGNNENALTKDIFDTLNAAGSLASSIASGDIVGMITNGGAFLAQMLTTLSGDNVAQERIEKMQKQVEQLDWSYQRLKKTFEDAWDTKGLVEYKNRTIANLKAQVQLYRNMIETEKDKKKTDYDQIRQWENTIEETMDAVQEMEESLIEQMGGLGSQSNFKSAAQDFADAWVDAFNESADSLAALEETFDGYFDNLIKKQVMNMASKKYLKKVFDYLDEIVSEGSAGGGGGTEVTAQELKKLQQIKDEQLPLFDNFVKNVLDVLGVNGKTKSSLSALQQGIQSVTESTAQALESLLNSIRFYVAQQSTDVTDVRNMVVASLGVSSRDSTIMRELESQTDTLKSIYSLLDSVTTNVANRGRCLKTYN